MLILIALAAAVVAVGTVLWFLAGRENPALVGRREQHQRALADEASGHVLPPTTSI